MADGETPEAPDRPLHGVMVHRIFEPEGRWRVELQLVGDMRPTELATVLELALAVARRQVGAVSGDR